MITGEGLIENSRSDLLTSSGVGGAAAVVALTLAALGVYGVIAFMVTTRTREIGVRLALGASRGRVLRDVLGDALALVVPGIGVGLVLAVAWVRLANPAWYPLGGVEPLVYPSPPVPLSSWPRSRASRRPAGGRRAADGRHESRVGGQRGPIQWAYAGIS